MPFNFKIPGLIFFSVAVAGLLVFYVGNSFLAGPSASIKEFNISSGTGFYEISNKLAISGIIRSEILFEIYALATNSASQFKPGRYFLPSHVSIPKLVEILRNGPPEIAVIIIPGMTAKEIDDRLSSLGIINSGELINFDITPFAEKYQWLSLIKNKPKGAGGFLEGVLLPDTYNFFAGSNISLIVEKFLDNFKSKALTFFGDYNSLLKTINLASILEKEVPDYNDRRLIAGILIKRLNTQMPLQADATLLYFKCSARFLNCPALNGEDYKVDSPYNTYLHNGLPETPINNPSVEAIKAALTPQKSDYWYYLSDPKTKKTIFSKTLDEQNQNRAKYLLSR